MAIGNKRRNSEKRKEKSRDAARCRRGKESEIFSELADQLPLHASVIEQLDKASVMRLLLSHLKLRSIMEKKPKLEPETEMPDLDRLYPKALEGFVFILSQDGDIIYMSETVAKYLGLQQIDLMGQSVYDFVHPCDHDELQDMLNHHNKGDSAMDTSTLFMRFKCTLTSKGRNVNLKSATYKVIRVTGRYIADTSAEIATPLSGMNDDVSDMEIMEGDDSDDEVRRKPYKPMSLPHVIAIGETIPHPSNIEIPLDRRTFTSRHSMNMKFTDCDDRIERLIGYHHDTMIGQSFFGFHHAMDSKMMEKTFKDLFSKGQATTGQYRFLAKNGGYVWMVTQATVIYNNKTQRPQCVVCVHFVLSHVEQHGRVLSQVQIPKAVVKEEPKPKMQCSMQAMPKSQQNRKMVADLFHVPTFSTEDVFKDKTDDMEQDFYPLGCKRSDQKMLPMPHTGPREGDVCIPLDPNSPGLLKEVDSFDTGLNLYDDFADIDSKEFKPEMELMVVPDSGSACSSGKTSPYYASNTPSGPGSPAECLSTINQLDISATDNLFVNYDMSAENSQDIDFTQRAPFIPMTSDEDFILSQPPQEVVLNMGVDFNPGVFGYTENVFKLKDELYEGPIPEKKRTLVEVMERTPTKASIEQPHDTMIMKMKRQLNRSCLEKGPPAKKTKKYQLAAPLENWAGNDKIEHSQVSRGNSVLKNLLLCGEDKDHGYSVAQTQNNISSQRQASMLQYGRARAAELGGAIGQCM